MNTPTRLMRIAYVTETWPPELNGVSLTVERTVRHLRSRGHIVELVRPRQPGQPTLDASDELRTAGCVIPMYPDLRFGLALPGTLTRRFETSRPDVVHLATPGPLAWAALAAARSLRVPTTSDFRTNFHQYSRHYGLGALSGAVLGLLRRFHNGTDRTFVPTRAAQRELSAQGFRQLTIVGRGVDMAQFTPAARSDALRRSWQAADDAPVYLAVGRIAAEKNVELALRAFDAVRLRQPQARMVVVGDGPAKVRLAARYPQAIFVGPKRGAELAAHYASADVFMFPSLSDTFGNVVMEALASGLAVLSFDCAAAAEHVVDRTSGRLVVPGDDAGFIAAAVDLALTPLQLAGYGVAAIAAARRANWDDVLTRFEARLVDTVDALETSPARLSVVA